MSDTQCTLWVPMALAENQRKNAGSEMSITPLKHFFKIHGQFEVKAMIVQRMVFVFSEGGSMKLGTQQENGVKMKAHVFTHTCSYMHTCVCV